MSFPSVTFLLFLSVTLVLYYTVPKRGQWIVLLCGSGVFYVAAGWKYLPFLLATILSTYFTARLMDRRCERDRRYMEEHRDSLTKEERKAFKGRGKAVRRRMLVAGLLFNFGILSVLKYTGFALSMINGFLSSFSSPLLPVPSLLLPLGISFYTFRSTAYLIDVYREKAEASRSLGRFALFISFFPAVIQGPISRWSFLSPQLFGEHRLTWENFSVGFLRMLWGFFKKLVVADTLMAAVRVISGEPETYRGAYVFLLILLYSAVIYGDFTGGIDITLGVARLFGVTMEENFRHPFSSRTTEEYWKRWHITMGSWFTDYVFYPLSVSKPMQKLTKWSKAHLGRAVGMRIPVYIATLVTWFLTGLWHGASWNFIVWGLLNGVIILISNECKPLYARFHRAFPKLTQTAFYGYFCATRTFLLMGLIRILDVYRQVPVTFRAVFSLFTNGESWVQLFDGRAFDALGLSALSWIVVGLSVLVLFLVGHIGKSTPIAERLSERPVAFSAVTAGLAVIILIFGSYGLGFRAGDFIYGVF